MFQPIKKRLSFWWRVCRSISDYWKTKQGKKRLLILRKTKSLLENVPSKLDDATVNMYYIVIVM